MTQNEAIANCYGDDNLKHIGRGSNAQAAFAKAAQLGDDTVKAAIKRLGN